MVSFKLFLIIKLILFIFPVPFSLTKVVEFNLLKNIQTEKLSVYYSKTYPLFVYRLIKTTIMFILTYGQFKNHYKDILPTVVFLSLISFVLADCQFKIPNFRVLSQKQPFYIQLHSG